MRLLAIALLFTATPALADVHIHDNDKKVIVDCAKDKSVMIHGNNAKVTLNGTCEKVMIAGNDAKVTGSATDVMVSGNDNKLDLDVVASIKVSGNQNLITYKKSPDPKTKVAILNSGNKNKITQSK